MAGYHALTELNCSVPAFTDTFQCQETWASGPGKKQLPSTSSPAAAPTVALICSNVTLSVPHQQKLIVY
jgi:hypothetical protein